MQAGIRWSIGLGAWLSSRTVTCTTMRVKAKSFICFCIVMPTMALPLRGAQTETLPVPPPGEILSKLSGGHPRLLASASDFAQLKERAASDAQLREWHQKLRDKGERILVEPPAQAGDSFERNEG